MAVISISELPRTTRFMDIPRYRRQPRPVGTNEEVLLKG
jgi:hypothetical protein